MATKQTSAQKEWPGQASDAQIDTFATVNIDETDTDKSVERTPPPVREEVKLDEEQRSERDGRQRAENWAEKSKAVKRRIRGIENSFHQRMAEQQAEFQRQIAAQNAEIDSLRRERTEVKDLDEDKHNAEMDSLQKQMEDAQEKGDSREAARLARLMSKKEGEFQSAKIAKMLGKPAAQPAARPAPAARKAPEGGPTPEARKWIRANDDWYGDPEFRAETREAQAIDDDLLAEGSDPNSPEHYTELRERLREKFPDLEVLSPSKRRARRGDDEGEGEGEEEEEEEEETEVRNRREQPRPRKPLSVNFNGGTRGQEPNNVSATPRGRHIQLSRAEQKEMRSYGLDPANNQHVRQWGREKAATDDAYEANR
jgi:hypothetical protein